MNARIQPVVALLMAFVAVPLFAQQGNPPTTGPASATQAVQSAAPASSASDEATQTHVLGTIVTLTADRLELKVEKAVEPNTESAAGLVGQTVAFAIDATTEKPADLKANDRVDLWFTEKDGQRRAVRIVVAAPASESSNGAAEQQGSSVPANPGTPATDQPSASAPSDPAEPVQVVGTIVTLTADRLDLKVEKAVDPNVESAARLVGQTVAFVVDTSTEKPADLKANDRVNLWFTEKDGQKRAVRITVVAAEGASSGGTSQPQGALVPPNPNPPANSQPAPAEAQPEKVTAAPAPAPAAPNVLPNVPPEASAPVVNAASEPSTSPAKKLTAGLTHHAKAAASVAKQPAASAALPNPAAGAEHTAALPAVPNAGATVTGAPPSPMASAPEAASPQAGGSVNVAENVGGSEEGISSHASAPVQSVDPLRFVFLGGVAALAALVMLFFTLRARHVDLGIGSGGGGVG